MSLNEKLTHERLCVLREPKLCKNVMSIDWSEGCSRAKKLSC